jgi:hypothetical protein
MIAYAIAAGAGALAFVAWRQSSGESRVTALRQWHARRMYAGRDLMLCMERRKRELEKRLGGDRILGVFVVGIFTVMTGGNYAQAIKIAGSVQKFRDSIRGKVEGCEKQLETFISEMEWIEAEAKRLGIDIDITDEELAVEQAKALGSAVALDEFRQRVARQWRADRYKACVASTGDKEGCVNPGNEPLYMHATGYLIHPDGRREKYTIQGYKTAAWFRGETNKLSPTAPGVGFNTVSFPRK